MFSQSKHMLEMKNRIFKMTLLISVIAFTVVSLTNVINRRPFVNFIIPFGSAVLLAVFLWLYNRDKFTKVTRTIYSIFLFVLYLPLAWPTSPGSYSAMSFYAVLIVFIGVILAREWFDYVYPIITVSQVVYYLNIEPSNPAQYGIYSTLQERAIDLTFNFLIVCSILFAIIMVLNKYFDTEHKRIYSMSITDQLTGIYNRHHLYHELENYQKYENRPFTILMMDLNNFKLVNDTYGNTIGDDVLRTFGNILNKACRKNDLPVRYGGDEFMLILSDIGEAETKIIQNRIIELFKPTMHKYKDVGLDIGFGIAESADKSIEDIMQIADDHLYKNKEEMKKMISV